MLAIDRVQRGETLGSRVSTLANGASDVTLADRGIPMRALLARARQHQAVYIVDGLRLAGAVEVRHPSLRLVIDIGDDLGSLYRSRGNSITASAMAALAQNILLRRACGVVCRGVGQAGALRALGISKVTTIPDLPTVPLAGEDQLEMPSYPKIGFIGSSSVRAKVRPAGWEVPEVLARLPKEVGGVMIVVGSGTDWLRRRVRELGVSDRTEIVDGCKPSDIPRLFRDVTVAISSQTYNLAGETRTTGKLVDYLAMGKIVVASRVGTAAAVLPIRWTVGGVTSLFSDQYVDALASTVSEILSLANKDARSLRRHSLMLAQTAFDVDAARSLWRQTLCAWGALA